MWENSRTFYSLVYSRTTSIFLCCFLREVLLLCKHLKFKKIWRNTSKHLERLKQEVKKTEREFIRIRMSNPQLLMIWAEEKGKRLTHQSVKISIHFSKINLISLESSILYWMVLASRLDLTISMLWPLWFYKGFDAFPMKESFPKLQKKHLIFLRLMLFKEISRSNSRVSIWKVFSMEKYI